MGPETTTIGADSFSRTDSVIGLLTSAFWSSSAEQRLGLCRRALASAPESALAALALASAYRERQDVTGARTALQVALRWAPDWAAVCYEEGKFWLGCDDMVRARRLNGPRA